MSATGDWMRRILIGACVLVAGSEVYLAQQNRALRQRVAAQSAMSADMKYLRSRTDRTLYEAAMQGRCQPFFEASAKESPARRYRVAIYFSLDHDCMSCVTDVVHQWNDVMRTKSGAAFDIHGYTKIDGTRNRAVLEQELRPAFPVTHIADLETKLKAMGMKYSPVVFVTDAATGRILFTHAPLATEKGDRTLIEKLQAITQPCV